ncbi:hypothetical protein IGW14_11165 [Streptomyces hygroscopicus subsp. hygroscopicus]|uniref:Uncharacterized protein n=2 Tax=Streptomyces TaxID=1883 RepID=A0ABT9KKG9_9ACTN|nr:MULTISPECIES: hypothetical protein [Streptomyces]MBW8088573.1 hypothetical protein [Streptomyces hygroscopicus subsp. hygroscopicus]MDN3056279.1 hypothetical protein [Streptomyces sp. SRF1]MDP9608911.1 hypothetical protein [Streptomyces demainii]GHJ27093.1 hypothetical protein TPA0910_15260 [Streptomyces hygroscopicus]
MKSLLWLLLTLAATVNVASNFITSGVLQSAVSVGTGVLALASGTCLFLTRDRRTA